MDRVMISYNVPNFITINLMAWLGLVIFFMLYNMVAMKKRSGGGVMSPGAEQIVETGGY
jgi:hypothetical protein